MALSDPNCDTISLADGKAGRPLKDADVAAMAESLPRRIIDLVRNISTNDRSVAHKYIRIGANVICRAKQLPS